MFKTVNYYFYAVIFIMFQLFLGLLFFLNQLIYKQLLNQLLFFTKLMTIILLLLFIFLANNFVITVQTLLIKLIKQKCYFHILRFFLFQKQQK